MCRAEVENVQYAWNDELSMVEMSLETACPLQIEHYICTVAWGLVVHVVVEFMIKNCLPINGADLAFIIARTCLVSWVVLNGNVKVLSQ